MSVFVSLGCIIIDMNLKRGRMHAQPMSVTNSLNRRNLCLTVNKARRITLQPFMLVVPRLESSSFILYLFRYTNIWVGRPCFSHSLLSKSLNREKWGFRQCYGNTTSILYIVCYYVKYFLHFIAHKKCINKKLQLAKQSEHKQTTVATQQMPLVIPTENLRQGCMPKARPVRGR